MKLLFLDTETTGNVPGDDRLVSVAYKVGDKLTHELFKPGKEISVDAMATHHITPAMVADKPAFSESGMRAELEQLLVDHVLVAHNASFDIAMLEAEGLTIPQFICTLKVARAQDLEGTVLRYGLQYLRYFWQLPVEGVVAHSADGDVLVLEALFNYLLAQARQQSDDTQALAAMLEISARPSLVQRLGFGKYRGERLVDLVQRDPGYLEWLLSEKEKALADGTGRADDVDFIYSLRHFLGRSITR